MADTDTKIINTIEDGIPLVSEPFKEMARKLDITEDYLIECIGRQKTLKVIRQISPIYDTRMLGFESSLITFKIAPEKIEPAAMIINSYPGVSHNYQRDTDFNLWFTIAVPPDSPLDLRKIVGLIAMKSAADDFLILSSLRMFKIGVKLSVASGANDKEVVSSTRKSYVPLTEEEKRIVRATQNDMPLISKPFEYYAHMLGMKEGFVIEKLDEFLRRGVFRRFAAVLYHRKIGYVANAMVVWKVPEEAVEETGKKIASFKAVSHCYERTSKEAWPYNLYSMIHGKSKDEVTDVIDSIKHEINVADLKVIYSTREFKKVRPKYFTEDYHFWVKDNVIQDAGGS